MMPPQGLHNAFWMLSLNLSGGGQWIDPTVSDSRAFSEVTEISVFGHWLSGVWFPKELKLWDSRVGVAHAWPCLQGSSRDLIYLRWDDFLEKFNRWSASGIPVRELLNPRSYPEHLQSCWLDITDNLTNKVLAWRSGPLETQDKVTYAMTSMLHICSEPITEPNSPFVSSRKLSRNGTAHLSALCRHRLPWLIMNKTWVTKCLWFLQSGPPGIIGEAEYWKWRV